MADMKYAVKCLVTAKKEKIFFNKSINIASFKTDTLITMVP